MITVSKKKPIEHLDLWKRHRKEPSRETRNQLAKIFLPFVKRLADRYSAKLPSTVDIDDLVSEGSFGLMESIERFDPSKGIKFETFAARRILGSMTDHLRKNDFVPRMSRRKMIQLRKTIEDLRIETGYPPTIYEISERLGVPVADAEERLLKLREPFLQSGDAEVFKGIRDISKAKCVFDTMVDKSPVETRTTGYSIGHLLTGFSRIERIIVVCYVFEKMTMKEIGKQVGVSESRVSQIMKEIRPRIKQNAAA